MKKLLYLLPLLLISCDQVNKIKPVTLEGELLTDRYGNQYVLTYKHSYNNHSNCYKVVKVNTLADYNPYINMPKDSNDTIQEYYEKNLEVKDDDIQWSNDDF